MTGRFVNADSVVAEIGNVQGYNLFAYCNNNPVMFDDPNGYWPKLSTILTIVAVAAVVVAAVAVVVATCGAAAPAMALAGGGIIGGLSTGAIATATTVATIATVTAVAATTAAVVTSKAEKPNNMVYKLVDPASNETKYVGRTTNETVRRNAHAMDAVLKPMVKQNIEVASGARQDYDYGRMTWETTKRFSTSFLQVPGNYTTYPGINKMIGNLPCSIARGLIKSAEEKFASFVMQ